MSNMAAILNFVVFGTITDTERTRPIPARQMW